MSTKSGLSTDNASNKKFEEIWAQNLSDRRERMDHYFEGAAKEMDQFAFLLGSWDAKQKLYDLDGKLIHEGKGKWEAETIDGGRMIVDKYLATLPNGAVVHGGLTLRTYNTLTNQWEMTYMGMTEPLTLLKFNALFEENEIRATARGVDLQGNESLQKVRFYDISENSFEWELEISWDDGETWYRVATTSAKRNIEDVALDSLGREPKDIGLLVRDYLAAKDLESQLNLYHPNALFYPPGAKSPIVGRDQLLSFGKQFMAANDDVKTIPNGEKTQTVSGNFAIVKSPYKLIVNDNETAYVATEVLIKNEKDEWVYLLDSPFGSK